MFEFCELAALWPELWPLPRLALPELALELPELALELPELADELPEFADELPVAVVLAALGPRNPGVAHAMHSVNAAAMNLDVRMQCPLEPLHTTACECTLITPGRV